MKFSHKEYWDKHARAFDSIYSGNKSGLSKILDRYLRKDMYTRMAYALRKSEPFQGRTFLDAGCGSGMYCLGMAQRGALKVTGIDISPRMLDLARERLQYFNNVDFLETDLLDFRTEDLYDVCIAIGFFDYIKDPTKYIEKLIKTTRGRIIVSFPRKNTLRAFIRKIRLGMMGLDVYFYSKKEIEDIFVGKGLKIENIVRIGQLYCLTADKATR